MRTECVGRPPDADDAVDRWRRLTRKRVERPVAYVDETEPVRSALLPRPNAFFPGGPNYQGTP